jgi:hypothetical protein
MIHELRIYTLKPGSAPEVAKNSGTVARAVRGDNYGKLLGYWLNEIGPLNQVVHLWEYASLDERARLRGELAKNTRWTGEYLPLIKPFMLRQDIRLMNAVVAPKAPAGKGNIYELRTYRLKPMAMRDWCGHFTEALPVREKYSKIVGLWSTEAGQPNEVCHIWAYPSFEERMKARAAAVGDPGWQAFLGKGGPLIDEMSTALMIPSAHSPMQ